LALTAAFTFTHFRSEVPGTFFLKIVGTIRGVGAFGCALASLSRFDVLATFCSAGREVP
jgi:hypothetical protein